MGYGVWGLGFGVTITTPERVIACYDSPSRVVVGTPNPRPQTPNPPSRRGYIRGRTSVERASGTWPRLCFGGSLTNITMASSVRAFCASVRIR